MPRFDEELRCPICLDLLEAACETNCGHSFCAHCLAEHLKRSNVCPLCRKAVSTAHASFLLRRLAHKARGDASPRRSDATADAELKASLSSLPARSLLSSLFRSPLPAAGASSGSLHLSLFTRLFLCAVIIGLIAYWLSFIVAYHSRRLEQRSASVSSKQSAHSPTTISVHSKSQPSASPSSPSPSQAKLPATREAAPPDENEHPLLSAARIGDTQAVERILRNKKRAIKEVGKGGMMALHLAAAHGNKDTAAALLQFGADIEAVSDALQRPLHLAVEKGHLALAQLLLSAGAQVDPQTVNGHTPLFVASATGFSDVAQLLLSYNAAWNSTDLRGDAPLHAACVGGHSLVVRVLLRQGADAAQEGWMLWTPLYIASRAGHVEVVRLLLDDLRGVQTIEVASKEGATPLYAYRHYVACEYGRTAVAQLLLSRGANLEVPMASGATPLVIAAQKGYREIVRSLLQHGARTDTAGARGMNALHLAAFGGFAEIIALLAAAGADLDAQDGRYATALHYAVLKKLASSVTLLLRNGADYTSEDIDGVKRVAVRVAPVAADDLVPTTVTLNSISTLLELRTQIERGFRSFRVVSLSTDSGAKYFFTDGESESLPTVVDLAGDAAFVSVRVALRPGTRRKEL